MASEQKAAKPRPGPKPDNRPHVTFRVQQAIYDRLADLQPQTGQTPDQIAGLVLHMVLNDPINATYRLNALLGSPHPDGEADLRSVPSPTPRKASQGGA